MYKSGVAYAYTDIDDVLSNHYANKTVSKILDEMFDRQTMMIAKVDDNTMCYTHKNNSHNDCTYIIYTSKNLYVDRVIAKLKKMGYESTVTRTTESLTELSISYR